MKMGRAGVKDDWRAVSWVCIPPTTWSPFNSLMRLKDFWRIHINSFRPWTSRWRSEHIIISLEEPCVCASVLWCWCVTFMYIREASHSRNQLCNTNYFYFEVQRSALTLVTLRITICFTVEGLNQQRGLTQTSSNI